MSALGGVRLGCALLIAAAGLQAQEATAILQPTQGNNVRGTIRMTTMGSGVHLTGTVTGLTAGKHGFHIHENGDCSAPDGSSAGGHFNPGRRIHGAPGAAEHHAGDLGNIEANGAGTATVDIRAEGITLGPDTNSVLGKSIIVHSHPDDFSPPAGNAGSRLACGIIK